MLTNEQAISSFRSIISEIDAKIEAIKSFDITDVTAKTNLVTKVLAPIIIDIEQFKSNYLEKNDLNLSPYKDIDALEYIPILIFFILSENVEAWQVFDDGIAFLQIIKDKYPKLFKSLFQDKDFPKVTIYEFITILDAI